MAPAGTAPVDMFSDPAAARSWTPSMAGQVWTDDEPGGEHRVGTLQLRRRSELRVVISRLIVPSALIVVAGIVIGVLVALGEGAPEPEPAAAVGSVAPAAAAPEPAAPVAQVAPGPVAQVAPEPVAAERTGAAVPEGAAAVPEGAAVAPEAAAAAPEAAAAAPPEPTAATVEPIVEPARPPALVDVRIDSTPSGATVTLVDRGKSQFVGTTPVSAAVDPSRQYDLVLTYESRPPHRVHLDPRTTRRVAVAIDRRRSDRTERADRNARSDRSELGEGTLMISSKPPCEIVIDGKLTGLMTPQRSITLPAGTHKVTLINREQELRKTISVQITASATEKVIEDLMK